VTVAGFGSFVVFAVILILVPGPDFAVTTRNTLVGGRRRGLWTAVGVSSAAAVQGIAAAAGLGVLIARAQPVFEAIKWTGIAYLAFLAVQAFRSMIRGEYGTLDQAAGGARGFRQGFLSNITNPKVLVFYLAVLPQFLGPDPTLVALLALALTHAVLGLAYLVGLVYGLHAIRDVLSRRRVRRTLDGLTGVALVGFGVKLALD
jgi:threonine/homoserine/homoserine lactone efflux protein